MNNLELSRRQFSGLLFGIPLSLWPLPALAETKSPKYQFPRELKEGDTIGLVSPSAAVFEHGPIDIAIEALERFGLNVKLSRSLKHRHGHLAGTDEERAAEINEMFANNSISGIVCLRGGSGAARILDKLDYELIRKNPKVFLGYSDITALQLAMLHKSELITFHGPVGLSTWDEFSRKYLQQLLFENELITYTNPPKDEDDWVQTKDRIRIIHAGNATGRLIGGNLTVLCGILGSEYVPDFKDSILFLEDVDEELYRIDRLMSQLHLAGILKDIKGFIFGKCTHCEPGKGYGSFTFDEIMDHYIKPLNIPAYSGAMIGHIKSKFTVPIGAEVSMDAEKGTFHLTQPALR